MVYAPVMITTLNRYEHFKRCIESLEKNLWAKYTDIYISVDYPPSEKYNEGYRAIIDYINGREFSAFKEVHLFFQKENLGMVANSTFLREKIFERFDRVIVLEDDIEAAVNFLEFMDKALEVCSGNENIYGIVGFLYKMKFPKAMDCTVFKANALAWGVGDCRDKYMHMREEISEEWMNDIVHDGKKMLKIFCKNKLVFHHLLTGYIVKHSEVYFDKEGALNPIDIVKSVYLIMNNMYTILPTVSKCRNWGFDGTGQNCGISKTMEVHKQEIDMGQRFDLKFEENRRINRIIECRYNRIFSAVTGRSNWHAWVDLLHYYYLLFTNKLK